MARTLACSPTGRRLIHGVPATCSRSCPRICSQRSLRKVQQRLGVGLEEPRRSLTGQFAEAHLAALQLHLGPGQALQVEAQLAGLLLEQGLTAHRLGHVAHLQQAVIAAFAGHRGDIDGLLHALAAAAARRVEGQGHGVQGMGQARRPAEIKGFPHHQCHPRIHVGAEGFRQGDAGHLAGYQPRPLFDPAIPQEDAALPADENEAHVDAVGEEAGSNPSGRLAFCRVGAGGKGGLPGP
jgi:hypothetical protein